MRVQTVDIRNLHAVWNGKFYEIELIDMIGWLIVIINNELEQREVLDINDVTFVVKDDENSGKDSKDEN